MVPRKSLVVWQKAAQGPKPEVLPFESAPAMSHPDAVAAVVCAAAGPRLDCYPSLCLGPGSSRIGPLFAKSAAGPCAEPCQRPKSPFAYPAKTAQSGGTITLQRGRSTCINLSRLWPFCPRSPLRAALASRSIPIVLHLGRLAVRLWVPPPKTTLHKAPLRAAFWGPWRAIRAIAANLFGGVTAKAIRAGVRVAFWFATAPPTGCAFGGTECSRRS